MFCGPGPFLYSSVCIPFLPLLYLCEQYCCHWKVVNFPSIKRNIGVIFHVMGSDLF